MTDYTPLPQSIVAYVATLDIPFAPIDKKKTWKRNIVTLKLSILTQFSYLSYLSYLITSCHPCCNFASTRPLRIRKSPSTSMNSRGKGGIGQRQAAGSARFAPTQPIASSSVSTSHVPGPSRGRKEMGRRQ